MTFTVHKLGVFRVACNGADFAKEAFVAGHGYWDAKCGFTTTQCSVAYYVPISHEMRFSEIAAAVAGKVDAPKMRSMQGPGSEIRNQCITAFDQLQRSWVLKAWLTSDKARDLVLVAEGNVAGLADFYDSVKTNSKVPYETIHMMCCRSGEYEKTTGDFEFINHLFPAPRAQPTVDVEQLLKSLDIKF